MLSWIKFVCTGTTFYGASIGEVRFGGTFRISDLEDVGLWSDFEILAENFKKIYHWTRFNVNNADLKSETRKHVAISIKNCSKDTSKHPYFDSKLQILSNFKQKLSKMAFKFKENWLFLPNPTTTCFNTSFCAFLLVFWPNYVVSTTDKRCYVDLDFRKF